MGHRPSAEDIGRKLLVTDHRVAWRVAIGFWLVAMSLFVLMAIPQTRDLLDEMDLAIYEATFPIKIGVLTALAHLLDFLGSAWFVWPVRLLVSGILAWQRRWAAVAAWWLAIAASEPLIGILKALYNRPRPPEALVETSLASFPSGHAVVGAVLAISLVIAFVHAGPQRRNLEIVAGVFALFMAGSRVYLGAHWLTDVIAGVALGAGCAIGAAAAVHWWTEHRPGRDSEDQAGAASSIT